MLSNFPYAQGEAIEVVGCEVVRLMAQQGHSLDVQVIIRDPRSDSHAKRGQWATVNLAGPRIRFLDTLYLAEKLPKPSRGLARFWALCDLFWSLPLLRVRINPRFFPAYVLRPEMLRRVEGCRPDVILSIWSWEALAATYDIPGVPKFVYYGNPDHKPLEARLSRPDLFGFSIDTLRDRAMLWRTKLAMKALQVQHVRMMNRCEVTANNSLVDATYYRDCGHRQSIYLQNMWPSAKSRPVPGGRALDTPPYKLLASVGNVGATGNTFGLHYLGQDLAPRLEELFPTGALLLDVLGGGTPSLATKKALARPSIRLRGWVDDIESEILGSIAFLVLTNVGGFIVGNTRILLAWSLGSCVVAHRNSALSMPEIVHGENALLGETPDEIAHWVEQAAHDSKLRRRIGQGGLDTYEKFYRSDVVVPKMSKEIERLVGARNRHPCSGSS